MKTGETEWTKTNMPCSSITAADNKLIILTRDGTLYIAEASPTRFKQLAKSKVLNGTCWTVPVLANHSLYVRNSKGTLHKLEMSKMIVSPQPLDVQLAGNDLEFSWPAKGIFILESTESIGKESKWNEVSGAPAKEDDRIVVRIRPNKTGQQFFRLRSK
jgi:hypothetical protein